MIKTSSKRKRPRPTRGTLVAISALLFGSIVVRIGSNTGPAIASNANQEEVHVQEIRPEACETPDSLNGVIEELLLREKRVEEQERQIESRMQALSVAESKLAEKLSALTQAEAKLEKTLSLADSAAENDLTKLTTVYENMKAKDASALFEEMAPEFSAGFLGRMKPESAALIMAGLSAERAYTISVILAGRNANVPKK